MKPVVLAALLLLAVASLVSGAPTESGIVSDDTPVTFVASGDELVALEVSGDITKEEPGRLKRCPWICIGCICRGS